MTPKEKAQELVDTFLPHIRGADRYNHNLESMNVFISKQCALIAVDVILNDVGAKDWEGDAACGGKNYWQEVKTEIEKL